MREGFAQRPAEPCCNKAACHKHPAQPDALQQLLPDSRPQNTHAELVDTHWLTRTCLPLPGGTNPCLVSAGKVLPEGCYSWDQEECQLVIQDVPSDRPFQVKAVTVIHPEQQTDLEGLFCVGGVYATQVRAPVGAGIAIVVNAAAGDSMRLLSCVQLRLV